ncbi:hypothetical protein CVT24_007937 [Panaeolus cyanescens]|uniref:Uncharacterized protein n=1 Tax=Panaeolus cyanescens TaxID=181874 RepID=A0A409WRM7_9AGAR|nr:hypothetical protein CVT24_007937 [Panaeolus cyanescens]
MNQKPSKAPKLAKADKPSKADKLSKSRSKGPSETASTTGTTSTTRRGPLQFLDPNTNPVATVPPSVQPMQRTFSARSNSTGSSVTAPLTPVSQMDHNGFNFTQEAESSLVRELREQIQLHPTPAPVAGQPFLHPPASYFVTGDIPRPNRIGNLQMAMGLQHNKPLYTTCRRVVRNVVGMIEGAYKDQWKDLDSEFITQVKNMAKARLPHLGRYRNGWATEYIMIRSNKAKRYYDRVLEKDPDGAMRKARAEARKAAKDEDEDEDDDEDEDGDEDDKGDDDSKDGDVVIAEGSTHSSEPGRTDDGADNSSELSSVEDDEPAAMVVAADVRATNAKGKGKGKEKAVVEEDADEEPVKPGKAKRKLAVVCDDDEAKGEAAKPKPKPKAKKARK